jgi:hypothetical protein
MPRAGTLSGDISVQSRVDRFHLANHTFVVGNVLFRDQNDSVWHLASLINLARFDSWLVTAVGPGWFEIPNVRGSIKVLNHGFGNDGSILYLDWRINGNATTDSPSSGQRRFVLGRIVNENCIDWSPASGFTEVV